jgi:hypothetical protein
MKLRGQASGNILLAIGSFRRIHLRRHQKMRDISRCIRGQLILLGRGSPAEGAA